MDVMLLTVGVIALGGGAAVRSAARHGRRAYEKALSTRMSSLRGKKIGTRVAVYGMVGCDQPLLDPTTQKPCIYYIVKLYEWLESGFGHGHSTSGLFDDDGDNEHRHLMHQTVERAEDWWIADDLGNKVLVHSGNFEVAACPSGMSDSDEALAYYGATGGNCEAESNRIPVGVPVFAEGKLVFRGDQPMLANPVTVDGRSKRERREFNAGLGLLAALLFALGGAFVFGGAFKAADPEPSLVDTGPRPLDRAERPIP